MSQPPDLSTEKSLLSQGYPLVAGMDEVGRGALGGPVSVGVVVVDASTAEMPEGIRDSKLLSATRRIALVPVIQKWAVAFAVGHASAASIDELGIIGALRLAGQRALGQLSVVPSIVLLDGSHDWLTAPAVDLFSEATQGVDVPVRSQVKADLKCASVAAASILAKTERDAIMADLAAQFPVYGWAGNKGYASADHMDAIRRYGPCVEHRRSWNLPVDESAL